MSIWDAVVGAILVAAAVLGWFAFRPRRAPKQVTGATEAYGAELRAMRNVEVSPELISDKETDLAWALAWHEFERGMQDEIDRVFAPLLAVLPLPSFATVHALIDDTREHRVVTV